MTYSEIASALVEAAHEGYCEAAQCSVDFAWFLDNEFPGYDAWGDYESLLELSRKHD